MTENEIKSKLEVLKDWVGDASLTRKDMQNAIDEAIKSLEEVQKYRAMEEKLNGISVKEVVNGFISAVEKETCEGYERGRILTNEDAEKWNAYRVIGTVEEFKALKEKSVEKKPTQTTEVFDKESYVGLIGKCPNCGGIVTEDMFVCEDCLQVLDWEGGE